MEKRPPNKIFFSFFVFEECNLMRYTCTKRTAHTFFFTPKNADLFQNTQEKSFNWTTQPLFNACILQPYKLYAVLNIMYLILTINKTLFAVYRCSVETLHDLTLKHYVVCYPQPVVTNDEKPVNLNINYVAPPDLNEY